MATTQRAALLWASFAIAALLYSMAWAETQRASIPMQYCATINTGGNMVPLYSSWQSDGRCFDNCTDLKYALAIVQAKNCWCSNLIPNPADQKPLSDCQSPCPGYPSDYCGGDGVYGYMEAAGAAPTGTAPAANPTSKSSSSSRSTAQPTVTVTLSASSSSSRSSASSTSASSTSSGVGSSPEPTVRTVTVGGTIRTVTAITDPTETNDPSLVGASSGGLQGGAIAGIVIGVVGGLAVIAAFVGLWFWRRRRRNEEDSKGLESPMRSAGSPGRMGTPKTGEASDPSMYTATAGSAAGWDSSTKRRSHLMPVDPRLDPYAKGIYVGDQNRSRESFNSLQDNQDYSRRVHDPPRVLRATNPDPDDD